MYRKGINICVKRDVTETSVKKLGIEHIFTRQEIMIVTHDKIFKESFFFLTPST